MTAYTLSCIHAWSSRSIGPNCRRMNAPYLPTVAFHTFCSKNCGPMYPPACRLKQLHPKAVSSCSSCHRHQHTQPGWTALHAAAMAGKQEAMQLLLTRAAPSALAAKTLCLQMRPSAFCDSSTATCSHATRSECLNSSRCNQPQRLHDSPCGSIPWTCT